MGKAKAPRRLADNEARAVLRTIRVSPQKLNLVAALIRGKKVATALNDLEFSRKRGPTVTRVRLGGVVGEAVEFLSETTRRQGIAVELSPPPADLPDVPGDPDQIQQVCLNLLNPSAAVAVPAGFPAQDFDRLLDRARQRGVGAINIRVLAAGALSGTTARHALAMPQVAPIASGADYASDVRRAQRRG